MARLVSLFTIATVASTCVVSSGSPHTTDEELAGELLGGDAGRAEAELAQGEEKRAEWDALCGTKPQGSQSRRDCEHILAESAQAVVEKQAEVVALQQRATLSSQEDAEEGLEDDLSSAQFDLDQLSEKRNSWVAMCKGKGDAIGKGGGLLLQRGSAEVAGCLKVVKNIEQDMAAKRREIASYLDAMHGVK